MHLFRSRLNDHVVFGVPTDQLTILINLFAKCLNRGLHAYVIVVDKYAELLEFLLYYQVVWPLLEMFEELVQKNQPDLKSSEHRIPQVGIKHPLWALLCIQFLDELEYNYALYSPQFLNFVP